MSKVVILVGSPRIGGNTQLLAEAFAEGASAHHEVEILPVARMDIAPCIGCNGCFAREDMSCFRKDDMQQVYRSLATADALVIASPIYFYGISAQLKAAIDRLHNPIRDTFHIKRAALLLCGAAGLPELFDAILKQYELGLKFFNIEDAGHVLVRHVKDRGDVANANPAETTIAGIDEASADPLDAARKLGANL